MSGRFTVDLATFLADRLERVDPTFPRAKFLESVHANTEPGGWGPQIAAALHAHLSADYSQAVGILVASLGPPVPIDYPMQESYRETPLACFVAQFGLEQFDASMDALYEIAKRSYAAQVAAREFIQRSPTQSMERFSTWTADPDPQIRRFVCGATRPRLRLKVMPGITVLDDLVADPRPVLILLDRLKSDASRSVREAVAASLSDVLRDQPDLGFTTIDQWLKRAGDSTRETIRMAVRHSAWRGDPRSLALLVGLGQR